MVWWSYVFIGRRLTPINIFNSPPTTAFTTNWVWSELFLIEATPLSQKLKIKEKEEQNIRQALAACGYPEWTVNKVKKERSRPKQKPPAKKQSYGAKSKGLVVVPYVQRLSEHVTRVF